MATAQIATMEEALEKIDSLENKVRRLSRLYKGSLTKRREIEAQLSETIRKKEAAYREVFKRWTMFRDNPDIGTYSIHRNECFHNTNEAFNRIFGFGPGELDGTHYSEHIAPNYKPVVTKKVKDRLYKKLDYVHYSLDIITPQNERRRIEAITCTIEREDDAISDGIIIDRTKEYEQNIKDPMTGLYNSNHFYKTLIPQIYRRKKSENYTPLSLIFIDVDNFKSYNDMIGHYEADQLIKKIGKLINSILKKKNRGSGGTSEKYFGFRVGGDEFAILCKNTDKREAFNLAEEIRKEYNKQKKIGKTSFSLGVYQIKIYPELSTAGNREIFVKRTDRAMYTAKHGKIKGKKIGNRTWVYGGLGAA